MNRETYLQMLEEAQRDVEYYTDKLGQSKFKLRALQNFDKLELNEIVK